VVGENATLWRKQYMPRMINPHDSIYAQGTIRVGSGVFLTIIAQRSDALKLPCDGESIDGLKSKAGNWRANHAYSFVIAEHQRMSL